MAQITNNKILVNYSEFEQADLYICSECAASTPTARYEQAEPGDEGLLCGTCGGE